MLKSILNLFFPKVCCGCSQHLLQNERVICTNCRHESPLTNHHKIIENENFNRFFGRLKLQSANALFYYTKKGIVQQLIHNLKFKGKQEIGTEIGNWLSEDLKNLDVIKTVDVIIPVPLHKNRFRERGYNQVETFGLALSSNLKIDYNPNILFKKVDTEKQSMKKLMQRNDFSNDVFEVIYTEFDHNKHFLLIDDVVTSGATLEQCAKTLLKIPGAKISIATMAMVSS